VIWSDLQSHPPSLQSLFPLYFPYQQFSNSQQKKDKDFKKDKNDKKSLNQIQKLHKLKQKVKFEVHMTDSLNNRFDPILPILTEGLLQIFIFHFILFSSFFSSPNQT